MAYEARAVANYFLELAKNEGAELNPMKLLKLVYFAHGWHLAVRGEPLCIEMVEAWKYGPVFPSVYHEFKKYGPDTITGYAEKGRNVFRWKERYSIPVTDKGENARALIKKVWDVYKKRSAAELSALTHVKNTPWYNAWWRTGEIKGIIIDNEAIERYFKKLSDDGKKRRSKNGSSHSKSR